MSNPPPRPSPAAPERQPNETNHVESNHQAIQWAFTWNNYETPEAFDHLQTLYEEGHATYIVYQQEIGEETSTPHLQGFIHLSKKQRRRQVSRLLPSCSLRKVTRGTCDRMIEYCQKIETRKPDTEPIEMGDRPKQQKRTDLDEFKQAVKDGALWDDLMDSHSAVIAKYGTFCSSYHNKFFPVPEKVCTPYVHRNWHDVVHNFIKDDHPQSDRQVLCIIDRQGAMGKSRLADHLESINPKVLYLRPGKDADTAHIIKSQYSIFIFDCPRSRDKIGIPFNTIEQIKDGKVMSGKYDSQVKQLPRDNRVIVFTNSAPDPYKLSVDRWVTKLAARDLSDPSGSSWNLHECRPNEIQSWDVMTYPNPSQRLFVLENDQVSQEKHDDERKRLREEDEDERRAARRRRPNQDEAHPDPALLRGAH